MLPLDRLRELISGSAGIAGYGQALQEGGLGGVAESILGDAAGSGDAAP